MTDQVKPSEAAPRFSIVMFHRQPKIRAGVAEHLCPEDRKVRSTDHKNINFPAGKGDLNHKMLLKPWLLTLKQRTCQTTVDSSVPLVPARGCLLEEPRVLRPLGNSPETGKANTAPIFNPSKYTHQLEADPRKNNANRQRRPNACKRRIIHLLTWDNRRKIHEIGYL